MPKFNSISISGYHMHEAGATAVQELAYTLADGMEYVRVAKADGLDIDDFAPRLSFFFGIGMNLFMEVAKLRAARTLWARIMTDLGAKTEKSKLLRTHCQTSGVSLTEQDPYNNIVRTTIEALAAVLGGTQSLHTNSFDEAIALPTDFSARIARNTQLILAEESGVTAVADPLGGSLYVEALTRELEERAWALIEEVEAAWRHDQGGRRRPAQDADRGSRRRARGQGRHRRDGDRRGQPLPAARRRSISTFLEVDNAKVRAGQIARLEKMRRGRDEAKARAALDLLETGRAATTGNSARRWRSNAAARLRCSLGEISDALERAFGRYHTNAGAGQRHLWPARATAAGRKRSRGRKRSPSGWAASPASWSPRWARTGTTAAPTWSARRSAIWGSR